MEQQMKLFAQLVFLQASSVQFPFNLKAIQDSRPSTVHTTAVQNNIEQHT